MQVAFSLAGKQGEKTTRVPKKRHRPAITIHPLKKLELLEGE
jgi:hypothetical protein